MAETFERRGGVAGKHGLVFQSQVAALLLARAVAADPEGARVGAEHAHAGCFDDVSVRVRRSRDGDEQGQTLLLLLQLKHRSGTSPAVGSQALRGDKGSFCVKKYYRSYETEVNVQKLNADPSNTYYVLYTNASLPASALAPASFEDVPEDVRSLLNSGCAPSAAPKLLRPEAGHLAGEPRAPEFQRRFVWMGEQAGEDEMEQLITQEVCAHVGRWTLDASQRVDALLRAVDEWYEHTGDVEFLSSQWVPWRALWEADPPLLRGLRFASAPILRLIKQLEEAPSGGVLHLMCDAVDVELRSAKVARASTIRPLLLGRLKGHADTSDVDVAISMWKRGWCRELVLILPERVATPRPTHKQEISMLGTQLISALTTNLETTQPDGEEGRALILLAPPVSKLSKEHSLVSCLRDHLKPRDLWTESSDSFAFRHLSQEIRGMVLQTPVNIQGRICTLADLGQDHVLDAALRGETLAALLRARAPLHIGHPAQDNERGASNENDLYIPRRMQKYIPVKKTVFDCPDTKDIFVVKDVTKDELDKLVPRGAKVQLFDRQDADTRFIACRKMSWARFRQFCAQNPGRRCHFLKNVNGTLMWRQSGGSREDPGRVAVVQEHLAAEGEERENNMAFVKGCESCTPFEQELVDADVRTVLISGSPGVGKSSVLARAAQIFAERQPSDWVIHLSLADYSDLLSMAAEEVAASAHDEGAGIAARTAEELLLRAAGFAHVGRSARSSISDDSLVDADAAAEAIAAPLLRDRMWETGRLRVLIDAFDEISPDYTEIVVAILKALQGTLSVCWDGPLLVSGDKVVYFLPVSHTQASCVSSLWIASRQLMEERLEQELGVGAFGLKPLSFADQERFWVQYWTHQLNSDEPHQDFVERAQELLKWLGGRFRSQFRLNIPLHSSILAQTFGESFLTEQFEERKKQSDVLYIYKKFIKVKFDIYIRDKAAIVANRITMKNLGDALYKDFMDKHKMCALMETQLFDYLPQKTQKDMYEKTKLFLEEVQAGSEKTGIIIGVKCGKPRFIHRTFAEYFAGIWLAENYKKYNGILDVVLGKRFSFIKLVTDQIISQDHPLHHAVLNDDVDELKDLLRNSATNVEDVDDGGRTVLSLAVQKNSPIGLHMCQCLLEKGAKVYGGKELFYAAQNQAWDNIKLLLRSTHSLDYTLPLPVIYAVKKVIDGAFDKKLISEEDKALDKYSLALNWNVFSGGRSILHVAVQCDFVKEVKILLKYGADCQNTDDELNTPLHYAVLQRNKSIVDILISEMSTVNPRNIRGETPLFLACSQGNENLVRTFLSCGSSANFRSKSGSTLLHAAVDHIAVLKLLLSHDCNINVTDSRGSTVLHEAVRKNDVDVVSLLIKEGANVNATNFQSCTPLLMAVRAGNVRIVQLLLEAGADVTALNSRGDSVLHVAMEKMNSEIISLLMKNGADVNIQNMKDETPLDISSNRSKIDSVTASMIRDLYGVSLHQKESRMAKAPFNCSKSEIDGSEMIFKGQQMNPLQKQVNEPCPQVPCISVTSTQNTQKVLEVQPSTYRRGNEISEKLLSAVRRRDVQLVKQIAVSLSKDPADWMAFTSDGDTPLHVAAKTCPAETVSLLCSRAPSQAITARNARGATPAHLSSVRRDHNVTLSLLAAGADPMAVDNAGDTFLHVACRLAVYKQVRHLSPRLPERVFALRNARGDTPLHLALALGECKEESALREAPAGAELFVSYEGKDIVSRWRGIDPGHQLFGERVARPTSRTQLVKTLLEATPANVLRTANAAGDTPAHVAARGRVMCMGGRRAAWARSTWGEEALRCLMERGVDVSATNARGDTVLHEMCRNPGEIAAVSEVLRATNARKALSMRNKMGNTPLHEAAEHCRDKEIVLLIVERGGDVRMKNDGEEFPFQVAARVGNIEVCNLLASLGGGRRESAVSPHHLGRSYNQEVIDDFLDLIQDDTPLNKEANIHTNNTKKNGHRSIVNEPLCVVTHRDTYRTRATPTVNRMVHTTPPCDGSEIYFNSAMNIHRSVKPHMPDRSFHESESNLQQYPMYHPTGQVFHRVEHQSLTSVPKNNEERNSNSVVGSRQNNIFPQYPLPQRNNNDLLRSGGSQRKYTHPSHVYYIED